MGASSSSGYPRSSNANALAGYAPPASPAPLRAAPPSTHDGWMSANLWTSTSAWPNHPAILPPLPREARSSQLEEHATTMRPATREESAPERPRRLTTRTPRAAGHAGGVYRTPVSTVATPPIATYAPAREQPRHATRHAMSPAGSADARPVRPATRQQTHARAAHAPSGVTAFPANLDWPSNFDDWMIDIMRRRALRLNSGARRRGASGSVRAVELAHIVERSHDDQGRWICAICDLPVTLDDLSFDHIVALADGGEHAAYNLAPTHRKCNEIKGSEKAQYRAQSLDRWLTEWAAGGRVPGGGSAVALAPASQPHYA